MRDLYRGPFIDASYKISCHLEKRFQRRRILEIDQSEKRIACGGHVCQLIGTKRAFFIDDLSQILPTKFRFIKQSDFRGEGLQKSTNQKPELSVAAMSVNGSGRNEQSLQRTIHRCLLPSFGSLGKTVSEEKIFRNLPIKNKNCLWRPCVLMDRDEMSNLYRGSFIIAPYQVSGFQRRRLKCEKLTDDRRRTPSDGKSHQGELKMHQNLMQNRICKILEFRLMFETKSLNLF